MIFTRAGPAEILRASQKDDNYVDKFQLVISDIILQLKGTRFSIKYKNVIDNIGSLIYYSITTLSGYQTLGEEYTGIIQTDRSLRKLPSTGMRAIMILLHCFGAPCLQSWLKSFEKRVSSNRELLPEARDQVLFVIKLISNIIPFIERLHKAIFYCKGGAYHISKRITGIHFVLSRYWLKDKESLYGFKILSAVTSIHLFATVLYSLLSYRKGHGDKSLCNSVETVERSQSCCSLCLDKAGSPSITPCGHVFCWSCILSWLQAHDACPICRAFVQSSRVVPLFNYSSSYQ